MLLRFTKIGFPCAVLVSGLLVTSVRSSATPTYAKKEGGLKCTVCHVVMGKKDLNDTGKCYKDHDHSLAACQTK